MYCGCRFRYVATSDCKIVCGQMDKTVGAASHASAPPLPLAQIGLRGREKTHIMPAQKWGDPKKADITNKISLFAAVK